ncbi:SPOR domain-containing protein [Lutimaribacter saemankumensis]|uniref:Cell division protein DedD (Protein involved in septation) n=1 Tax=Lutimaribacter saemankumensis TaxID=490829 RepID=A0A1G8RGS9_9RHOB|nr:SPOR domain-containing protein [Lutimaribacter saemankumensis]SDJ16304.1 Cell division protein DedD (protein involved in septation) [Lutimaribacter saemankumensis]
MNITAMGRAPARSFSRLAVGTAMVLALSACNEAGQFNLFQKRPAADAEVNAAARSVKLIERDVEAPDVFQVTEPGLWDGRPSLGGVWVAHPDVDQPERVIIRNTKNDTFVIGALFRRERENPGPAVQVSSDAAAALEMLAGQPMELNITALRREEVPAEAPQAEADTEETLGAPADVAETTLAPAETDAVTVASAAIAAAEARTKPQARPAVASPATAPQPTQASAPAPAPRASGLEKPYLQIGIFSVETNAQNTAQAMRTAGMVPTVKKQTSKGKTFWRVLVGPATSSTERAALLKKIKAKGFEDAYAVTN